MAESLDIAEVARRTGLTARALRFYEARGLLTPLRTASGRRHYGPAELARIHQIMALKRAGLSLAQIQALTSRRSLDLRAIVAAQRDALDAQAREIGRARNLLTAILSRIDRSEPIDVATFCSLIESGERLMTKEKWDAVTSRYFSDEDKAAFAATMCNMSADFDQDAYGVRWKDLGGRIKAALPLDPASDRAQAFLAEWQALLKPFADVATPAMMSATTRFYEKMDEWQGEGEGRVDPGFDAEVFRFIQAASRVRQG